MEKQTFNLIPPMGKEAVMEHIRLITTCENESEKNELLDNFIDNLSTEDIGLYRKEIMQAMPQEYIQKYLKRD